MGCRRRRVSCMGAPAGRHPSECVKEIGGGGYTVVQGRGGDGVDKEPDMHCYIPHCYIGKEKRRGDRRGI